jgi:hypothetical protein
MNPFKKIGVGIHIQHWKANEDQRGEAAVVLGLKIGAGRR